MLIIIVVISISAIGISLLAVSIQHQLSNSNSSAFPSQRQISSNSNQSNIIMQPGAPCHGSVVSTVYNESGFTYYHRLHIIYPAFFEFVLKPNSTGYITMLYDFTNFWHGTNGEGVPANGLGTIQNVLANYPLSKFASNVPVHKVEDYSWSTQHTPEYYGLDIHPTRIINMTDSLLAITYAITDTHAQKGTTYLVNFDICPGELVTIGDSPRQEPLPFNNSTVIY
jgi:hypothetical protein